MQCGEGYGSPAVPAMSVPLALGIYARRCQAEGSVPKGVSRTVTVVYGSVAAQQEPLAGYFLEDIFSCLTCWTLCLSAFQINARANVLSEQFWVLLVALL